MADEMDLTEEQDTSSEMTASQLVAELKDTWRNERIAPELLPHKEGMLEVLLDLLKHMEKSVAEARTKEFFRCLIHRMELNRVRFMLSNYLRCRLEKLEMYSLYYMKLPESQRKILMTESERKFLERYQTNTDELIGNSLKSFLPEGLPILDAWHKAPLKPRLDVTVFAKPKEDLNGIFLEGPASLDVPITIEKDQHYMLRYSSVQKHVHSGKVILM